MASAATPQHPDIDAGMWEKIHEIIDNNHDKPGSVITVLRECQDVVGYLPKELLNVVSQGLNLPFSQVYGVATFYSLFSLEPKGRHTIKVCMGTACYVRGIKDVMDRISRQYDLEEGKTSPDRRFSLESVRCLGACGLAPVLVVDQDIHGIITSEKALSILEKYE